MTRLAWAACLAAATLAAPAARGVPPVARPAAVTADDDVRYPRIGARWRTHLTDAERASARVTEREAVAAFRANVGPDLARRPRDVVLAVFSDDVLGPAGAPSYQDVLAWVVTVPDAPAPVYGPPGAPATALACDYVWVLDARTREGMTAFQSC
ncbi:MAG TPA: hypothetical protein VGX28_07690 [Frankiaceae bacterium]|nr:hypothetical protein [Frankiaceae bacterium]